MQIRTKHPVSTCIIFPVSHVVICQPLKQTTKYTKYMFTAANVVRPRLNKSVPISKSFNDCENVKIEMVHFTFTELASS